MADAKTTSVIGEGGDILDIPTADLQNALRQGYTPASPEQLKEYDLQQKYGEGLGNEARALAEGAARVVPGADAIQTALGVDPEGLKERQERNPLAAGVGEVGANIASVATGVGPASWIAKGGAAATKATAKAIGVTAADTLVKRTLAKAASVGAGSAIEGVAYEAGHLVNEAALGDPKEVAERAIAQLGLAALMGGALGGVLGTAEELFPAGILAAKDATGKLARGARDKFEDLYPKGLEKATGIDEAVSARVLAERHVQAADPEKHIRDTVASLDEQHRAVKKAIREAPRAEESEILTQSAKDPATGKTIRFAADDQAAAKAFQDLNGEVRTLKEQMRQEPDLFPARFRRKLELIDEGLERDFPKIGNAAQVFERTNLLKQQLDDLIGFGKLVADEDRLAKDALKGLRSKLKATLEDPSVFAAAGDRQAIYNAKFTEFQSAEKDFLKAFGQQYVTKSGSRAHRINPKKVMTFLKQEDQAAGSIQAEIFDRYQQASKSLVDELETTAANVPGASFDRASLDSIHNRAAASLQSAREEAAFQKAVKGIGGDASGGVGDFGAGALVGAGVPGGAAGLAAVKLFQAARDPRKVAKTLAALERLGQQTERAIEGGARALVKGSRAVRPLSGMAASRMVNAKTFNERVDRVTALANNPDLMHETISKATEPAYEYAPQTAGALSISQVMAIQALAAATPKGKKKSLLGPAWQPSKAEMAGFNRIWNAIDKPTSILDLAAMGTLTSAEVGAVKSSYPALFKQMQTAVLSQVADGKPVPYRNRAGLSMILETDVDGTFNPDFMSNSQALYQAAEQEEQSQDVEFGSADRADIGFGSSET